MWIWQVLDPLWASFLFMHLTSGGGVVVSTKWGNVGRSCGLYWLPFPMEQKPGSASWSGQGCQHWFDNHTDEFKHILPLLLWKPPPWRNCWPSSSNYFLLWTHPPGTGSPPGTTDVLRRHVNLHVTHKEALFKDQSMVSCEVAGGQNAVSLCLLLGVW